jgi:predicted dehydrogenase
MSATMNSDAAPSQTQGNAIRVGLIGYGMAVRTFHAPLIEATQGLALVALSTSRPEVVKAERPELEVEATPEALLARQDIDLVIIATPNETHYPLASAALAAGKHVVVDKPFTVTLAEGEALAREAEQAERVLAVFHNRRFDADFLTLVELIEGGTLGRIAHMESHFDRFRPSVPDRWREQALPGSGLWYDLGPHLLDQALCLFGEPASIQLTRRTQREGAVTDDFFHTVLSYASHAIYPSLVVELHASALAAAPTARFAVHGTRGSYVTFGLDPQEACLKAGSFPARDEAERLAQQWGRDPRPGMLTVLETAREAGDGEQVLVAGIHQGRDGDDPAWYARLRDCIRSGSANPTPADEALRVMKWLEAGIASEG